MFYILTMACDNELWYVYPESYKDLEVARAAYLDLQHIKDNRAYAQSGCEGSHLHSFSNKVRYSQFYDILESDDDFYYVSHLIHTTMSRRDLEDHLNGWYFESTEVIFENKSWNDFASPIANSMTRLRRNGYKEQLEYLKGWRSCSSEKFYKKQKKALVRKANKFERKQSKRIIDEQL